MKLWRILLAGVVAMLLPGVAGAQTQPPMTPLTIMVFQGVQNLPLFAAQVRGFFGKRNLEVDIKIAPTSDEMRNGLAEGRYQIVHGAVDNAVAMAEVAKADIAVISGGDNGWNQLIVQPDIAALADLRGKTVIVDAPNTAYALQLYELLGRAGLKKGEMLDGEGGYCVWGKQTPADRSLDQGLLPLGLAHNVKLKRDIATGEQLKWADVEYDPDDFAVKVRREMEAAFGRRNV